MHLLLVFCPSKFAICCPLFSSPTTWIITWLICLWWVEFAKWFHLVLVHFRKVMQGHYKLQFQFACSARKVGGSLFIVSQLHLGFFVLRYISVELWFAVSFSTKSFVSLLRTSCTRPHIFLSTFFRLGHAKWSQHFSLQPQSISFSWVGQATWQPFLSLSISQHGLRTYFACFPSSIMTRDIAFCFLPFIYLFDDILHNFISILVYCCIVSNHFI